MCNLYIIRLEIFIIDVFFEKEMETIKGLLVVGF